MFKSELDQNFLKETGDMCHACSNVYVFVLNILLLENSMEIIRLLMNDVLTEMQSITLLIIQKYWAEVRCLIIVLWVIHYNNSYRRIIGNNSK